MGIHIGQQGDPAATCKRRNTHIDCGLLTGERSINTDGFPDLVVGAYADENNGVDSGSARLFLSVTRTVRCLGDLDGGHVVNFTDLNGVLSNFGAACPE